MSILNELAKKTSEQANSYKLSLRPLRAALTVGGALVLAAVAGAIDSRSPFIGIQSAEAGCGPAIESVFNPYPQKDPNAGNLIIVSQNQYVEVDLWDSKARDPQINSNTVTTVLSDNNIDVNYLVGVHKWAFPKSCTKTQVTNQVKQHLKDAGTKYYSQNDLLNRGLLEPGHGNKSCTAGSQIGPFAPDSNRAPLVLTANPNTIIQFDIWDQQKRSGYGQQEVPSILDENDQVTADPNTGVTGWPYNKKCLYGAELDLRTKAQTRNQFGFQRPDQIAAAGLIHLNKYGNRPLSNYIDNQLELGSHLKKAA